jgi:stringent starvation protein B
MSNSPPDIPPAAATSPSASGPAGALFEGQVGAHYLLTMLAEADPRGLPGATIETIELQRASEGHPLDDVIVRGTTTTGEPAVLEVQAKRTVTFAPADTVFKDVVRQLAQAFQNLDVSNERHQFAVATERTSFKITGPYQDVLRWAREVGSASTFIERINRKNVGNEDMRTFVATVRFHLTTAGCASNDQTVWEILRRFHILTFDYDAPGSQSNELALERARHLLESDDASRASAFWKVLTETAIRVAAAGGALDRSRLLAELGQVDNFRLIGSRRSRAPRETLSEGASLAAADLRRSVAGVTLARTAQLEAVRAARDVGRYVEIVGGPGVGKSGLLGMLVQQMLTEARAIVLSPERTIPGGWVAFKSALGVDASPQC